MMVWSQLVYVILCGKVLVNVQVIVFNFVIGIICCIMVSVDGSYMLIGLWLGIYQVDVGLGMQQNVMFMVVLMFMLNFIVVMVEVLLIINVINFGSVMVLVIILQEVKILEVGGIIFLYQIDMIFQVFCNFFEFVDIVFGMVFM